VGSLDDLFSREPKDWTPEEVASMVQHLRAARKSWAEEEKTAKSSGRSVKPSAGIKESTLKGLELDDDDFDLDAILTPDPTE